MPLTEVDKERLIQLDASVFAIEKLGMIPDPWQETALTSEKRRQIYNCCRQSGKTQVAAIKALHTALYYPDSLSLLLSPSLRQSNELFRRIKQFYRMLQKPPRLLEDTQSFLTVEGGGRILSLPGTEETVRGFAAPDLIVIDEDAKVSDTLFQSVTPMQATNPQGKLLLMSTPYGKHGHFWRIWDAGPETIWLKLMITADECPRISAAFLEEQRQILTEEWFLQEYYCKFLDLEGSLFSGDDIQAAFEDAEIEPFDEDWLSEEVEIWGNPA